MEALQFEILYGWTRLNVAVISLFTSSKITGMGTPHDAPPSCTGTTVDEQSSTTRTPQEQLEIIDPMSNSGDNSSSENVAEDESQYPPIHVQALTFVSIALALVVTGVDSAIVATAVPSITDEFGAISDIGWYSAAFKLGLCSFQFMFGRMYQVWPIKRVLLSCLLIFELGSLLCGVSPTSKILVLGRALQGLGCSGMVSGCFSMVSRIYPRRRRPMLLASAAFVEEASSAVAPLLGGVLTSKLNWRWCFYINLPLGFLAIVTTAIFHVDTVPARHAHLSFGEKIRKLDLTGTLLFVPGIASLLVALQFGGTTFGWSDPRIIALFVVAAVLIILFAWWQVHRQDEATLPPRILKRRNILAGMLFVGCNNSACAVVQYYLPIYFQTVMQLSPQASGYLILPYILSFMFSILSGGALTSAIGYYAPPMLFTSLLVPVAIGMLSTLTVSPDTAKVVGWQVLLGCAAGFGFQGPQVAIQTLMDPADLSYGVACLQFAQGFLPALFIPVAQSIFSQLLTRDLIESMPGAANGVNSTNLENIGLSDLRDKVQASQLNGALVGFDRALMSTFYLPTALACLTVVGTLGIEWRNIKMGRANRERDG